MSRDLIGMFHDRQHHLINFLIKRGKEFTHFLFFPICYLKVCSGTKKKIELLKRNAMIHTTRIQISNLWPMNSNWFYTDFKSLFVPLLMPGIRNYMFPAHCD